MSSSDCSVVSLATCPFPLLKCHTIMSGSGFGRPRQLGVVKQCDCICKCISLYVCVCLCERTLCEQTSHLIYSPWCKGWWLPAQLNAMQMLLLPSGCQSRQSWHSRHATGAFTAPVIFTKWEITLACPSWPGHLNNQIPTSPTENAVKWRRCIVSEER